MNHKIQVLDEHCINQIAAGEVVERPLSVVKELVENALDASAKKIDIRIEGSGAESIKVSDDGSGILPEDLRLAVLPHATSKIRSLEDLLQLQTLGFRGEALPSIASVAKLSMLSRLPDEISGYEIIVEGGKAVSFLAAGCPAGTVVTVKDLFYNTPARKKFLRSGNAEFGLISEMVGKLALARPDVAFFLRHPDNLILNTPGQGNLLDTIAAVLGNNVARKMIPLSFTDGELKMTGFISKPELVRASGNGITYLVNGRVVRSQLLLKALKDGYHTLIPAGTYPFAVISLTMPPAAYDVNVHPAKLDIKFKAEKDLAGTISRIVRETLLAANPIRGFTPPRQEVFAKNDPAKGKDREQLKYLYQPSRDQASLHYSTPDSTAVNPAARESYIPGAPFENPFPGYPAAGDGATGISAPSDPASTPSAIRYSGIADTAVDRKGKLFQELRALGQLFNTYILCTDEKSLYIIDQHAAHERIRYEALSRQLASSKLPSQLLLLPETIELSVQEEQIMLEHFSALREMGFIIEQEGERIYHLRGLPMLHNLANPGRLFLNYLDELLNYSVVPSSSKLLEEWIFMLACRTAVKGRERLSPAEMDLMISELGKTENPFTCPHGRPAIIELTRKELEKRFGR